MVTPAAAADTVPPIGLVVEHSYAAVVSSKKQAPMMVVTFQVAMASIGIHSICTVVAFVDAAALMAVGGGNKPMMVTSSTVTAAYFLLALDELYLGIAMIVALHHC